MTRDKGSWYQTTIKDVDCREDFVVFGAVWKDTVMKLLVAILLAGLIASTNTHCKKYQFGETLEEILFFSAIVPAVMESWQY